jgi:RNA polymerase sigma factor (sigma-70 family)
MMQFYAGDDNAFTEVYEDWFPRLSAFFRRRFSFPPEDAEDCAEDALIKVYNTRPSGRGRFVPSHRPFVAWLIRIAHNHGANQLRYWRCRPDLARPTKGEPPPPIEEEADRDPSPHEQAQAHELEEAIRDCIGMMAPPQREVLVMKLEGRTPAEIAARLGRTARAITMLLHRARVSISECLQSKGRI